LIPNHPLSLKISMSLLGDPNVLEIGVLEEPGVLGEPGLSKNLDILKIGVLGEPGDLGDLGKL
jgi:hypothetical protein